MHYYMAMGDLSFKADPLIIGWVVYGFADDCDSMMANGSDAGFKYPVGVEEEALAERNGRPRSDPQKCPKSVTAPLRRLRPH